MSTRPVCVSPRCRRNADGQPDPRAAADGLNLCWVCTRVLGEDILITAVRYRQLGLVLAAAGRPGEKTSGSRDPNAHLNLRAAALRRDVERVVGGLAARVADERGFTWPTEPYVPQRPPGFIGPLPQMYVRSTRLPVLVRFVARSAQWLAARGDAADTAGRLRELATGETYRVAFPGGVRKFVLPGMGGEKYLACPETVEDGQPCPGVLWTILRRDGDRLPSQLMCNHDEVHQWPTQQWLKLGRRLLRATDSRSALAAA
jgi:hypothetical protein